jgi:putative ABC transport system permease protein
MKWLRQIFLRGRMYGELSDEIRQHLDEKVEALMAGGMSRMDAEAAARREFGNVMLTERDGRSVWQWSWIEDFLSDVRYGLRGLSKNPAFTAIAVLTLALGIGATTAIYSVTYATLLAPLPYPHPDQLVMVWPQFHGHRVWGASAGDFLDWKRQSTVFEDLNATPSQGATFNLATAGHPEHVRAQVALPGHYQMMGVPFLLGRNFLAEEGTAGKEHVVILTYKLWKRLGANNAIVGQQLRMNGELYTVVGVTAPGPLDRIQFDLIVPLVFKPDQINHAYRWLFVMGRLKPGVTLAEAQAEMSVVARRIAQDHPDTNKNWEVSVERLQNDFLPSDTKVSLWLLLGAVGFVLCIACVNVANLLLARSSVRQREVAVRVSLGASRQRIFSQFLTESLVLAVAGGAVGVGLAGALVKVVVALLPEFTLPSEANVTISLAVLLFTVVVSVSAGVLFGCAPAWQASGVDPNRALKGDRAGGGRRRLRQALVVMEFGLALTLLCGAGMALRSFWNLAHVDLGVRTDHILTFTLPVPEERLKQPEQMIAFYRDLVAKMRALPGVSAANVATGLPVEGPHRGKQFWIAGTPHVERDARPNAGFQAVTPGYFEAFGIETVKGRAFTEEDRAGGVRVAVVNENFVRRYLPNVDPLTQRIVTENEVPGVQAEQPLVEWQIVGVFRNVRSYGLRDDKVPEMDVPFWQSPWPGVEMAVRTAGDPALLTKSIQEVVSSMESDLPLANVKTMDQIVDDRLAGDRFYTVLNGGFAGLALVLAAVGIYGVMAFAVAQRTHEIGLRLALGAGRNQVMRMVLREGALLALLGMGFGLIGACLVGRVLKNLLYEVAAIDLGVFAGVALTLLIAAVAASYVPAWRAARVDPMVALRYE